MYKAAPEHETVRAVVAPAAGRLIVFWSDYRVPHRVKPTTVDRYVKEGAAAAAAAATTTTTTTTTTPPAPLLLLLHYQTKTTTTSTNQTLTSPLGTP